MSIYNLKQGGCHTKKKKGHFSTQSVNCSGHVANIASQKKIEKPWIFCKETGWPCKQEAESFDEKLWQMTPIPASFFCSKACDIIAEDAFSVASQHSIGQIDIKWGTYMRPQSRYVTWYIGEMPWNANLFQWEFPACGNRMSWKQSAGRRCREAARCIRERQIGKQIESCTLPSKKWGALEALWQMTPTQLEQLLFVAKHVTLSPKMRLALPVSIPLALLTSRSSSEVLTCVHREDLSLDMSEKSEPVPVRIPRLLEQNVLKAVCRTQIKGSCKVYAGKTNWKTNWKLYLCKQEVRSTWSTLADDFYSSSIYLFQNMWHYGRRYVYRCQSAVQRLVSSISRQCLMRTQRAIRGFSNWDWKFSRQSPSIFEHCKKTPHHTKWPCLLQRFSSFLLVWPYWLDFKWVSLLVRQSSWYIH